MTVISTVQQRLRWFQIFIPLYEKGNAIIQDVTNLDGDGLPIGLDALFEGAIALGPVLEAVRSMPEPKERELRAIRNEFKTALYNYIKAAEFTANYIRSGRHTLASRVQLNAAINSIVLAGEYMGSVSRKLSVPTR